MAIKKSDSLPPPVRAPDASPGPAPPEPDPGPPLPDEDEWVLEVSEECWCLPGGGESDGEVGEDEARVEPEAGEHREWAQLVEKLLADAAC